MVAQRLKIAVGSMLLCCACPCAAVRTVLKAQDSCQLRTQGPSHSHPQPARTAIDPGTFAHLSGRVGQLPLTTL
jgi:hypothetical protein